MPGIQRRHPGWCGAEYSQSDAKGIADHGGKYLAGGYNKTLSLSGGEPPNRVPQSRPGAIRAPWTWRTPLATSKPHFASMAWRAGPSELRPGPEGSVPGSHKQRALDQR